MTTLNELRVSFGIDKLKADWWAGQDDEYFTDGPFVNREDAIAFGEVEYCGDGFHIINAIQHSVKFDADEVITDQYWEKSENLDYFDHDRVEPTRVGSPEVIEAADKALQVLLDSWLELYRHTFQQPNMFSWSAPVEYIQPKAKENE